MKILVVDDDRDLVEMVNFALKRAGFDVLRASDPQTVMRTIADSDPDLAVLDVNLGAWNGFDILRDIRRVSQIPVIMLTGRDAEDDKVRGLELGADDYVTKPFSYRELIARIRTNIRRHRAEDGDARSVQSELAVGGLTLNVAEHVAAKHGQPLKLTVTEFRLLQCLMESAGSVVATRALLRRVWGYDDPSGADLVRVTVYRLRRKIEDDPSNPVLVHTVPGVGVMLKPPA
jgi:two-component system response regulator VicR